MHRHDIDVYGMFFCIAIDENDFIIIDSFICPPPFSTLNFNMMWILIFVMYLKFHVISTVLFVLSLDNGLTYITFCK